MRRICTLAIISMVAVALQVKAQTWSKAEGLDDGRPISIAFITRPPENIVLSEYSNLLVIKWAYESLNDSGMPHPGEFDRMKSFEDMLTSEFEKANHSILVQTFLGSGVREFYYYSRSLPDFDNSLNKALANHERFPITITRESDPKWETYFNLSGSFE